VKVVSHPQPAIIVGKTRLESRNAATLKSARRTVWCDDVPRHENGFAALNVTRESRYDTILYANNVQSHQIRSSQKLTGRQFKCWSCSYTKFRIPADLFSAVCSSWVFVTLSAISRRRHSVFVMSVRVRVCVIIMPKVWEHEPLGENLIKFTN